MARKIYGTLKDQTRRPLRGLRVQAWDNDEPDGDDIMGQAVTDTAGKYEISYRAGHWDVAPHWYTKWRPDIYIKAHIRNSSGNWVQVEQSRVYKDHRLSENLRVNLKINIQPPARIITSFKPTAHGFHFNNSFTINPAVLGLDLGTWPMGLCGGMCAAALSRYTQNQQIPANSRAPRQRTSLYGELLKRQLKSTPPSVLAKVYDWQSAPDEAQLHRKPSVASRTKQEWWKLKDRLDQGLPAIIVLIRAVGYLANPGDNHQVLAIGYDYNPTSKDLRLQVYDPNDHDQTNTLSMNLGRQRLDAQDSTGQRLRGFFVNPAGDDASA